MLRITHLKWLLSLLIPAGAYFAVQTAVQADPSLNPHLPMFFAITLWAITVWATDILPAVPSAAAMTFLYLLCNVAPAPVIFGAWGAFLPWICFGALILSEALELDPKSRISSAIIMAGFCSATSPGYGFLTGTEMSLIAMDQIKSIITIPTWGEYALANLPFIILYCCFSIFMCVKIIPGKEHIPHEDHLKEVVAERLRDMGPMTTQEWKLLILMICAITGLLTSKWHGLNGYFLYALIAICCYLPWIGLASFENVRKLNVGFLVFIVACLGMGSVAVHLGAAKWFASLVVPLIDGLSPIWLVLSSYLSAVAVNFMLTPLAAVSALSLPWAEIAQHVNMNPLPMLYSFLYGLDQYIFPYEYALYMYIFSTGYITPKHMFKGLGLRILFVAVILMLLQVPYWKLIGLM